MHDTREERMLTGSANAAGAGRGPSSCQAANGSGGFAELPGQYPNRS